MINKDTVKLMTEIYKEMEKSYDEEGVDKILEGKTTKEAFLAGAAAMNMSVAIFAVAKRIAGD